MYFLRLLKQSIKNKNSIINKNFINFPKLINYKEPNKNLHRWCLNNKNKTKREINYPW